MNAKPGAFIAFDNDLDPSVAASIGSGERRQSAARLPAKERSRKAKERTKATARLARRVNWDLPESVKARVKELASEHSVPESQVAALLLVAGLQRIDAGVLDITDYKVRSDSPRYLANLAIEEITKNVV
jgi:hypothetical protein